MAQNKRKKNLLGEKKTIATITKMESVCFFIQLCNDFNLAFKANFECKRAEFSFVSVFH